MIGARAARAEVPEDATSTATARTASLNDGKILNDPKQYSAMFHAVDGDTMKVVWGGPGLHNVDSDYQGKYCWSTCYNSEEA